MTIHFLHITTLVSVRKVIIAICLIVGTLALSWGFIYTHSVERDAQNIGKNVTSFEDLSDRFRILAQQKGAEYAFSILRVATLPAQTDLHLLGHIVGEELYAQQGVAGIQVCTPDFRNACSHSIVIGALAELGEGALPKIKEACEAAPGGVGAYTMCFHGLGHGVFAGYGYELERTIDFCKKTGTDEHNQREYTECFGGAIMELMGGGGHDESLWLESRETYLQDPLDPCLRKEVPDDLREICLIYITPRIWEVAGISLANPDPTHYAHAFESCDRLPKNEENLRNACFAGFGKEFVPLAAQRDIRTVNSYTDTQLDMIIQWCMSAEAEDGQAACTSEALASLFWGGENDPWVGVHFCQLVADTQGSSAAVTESCFSRLGGAIGFFIEDQSLKEQLCAELPYDTQDICDSKDTYW